MVVLNNDRLNSFKLKTSNNQDKSVEGNSENMDLEVSFTSLDSENSVVDMTGLPVGLLSKLKRYPHLRIVCLVKIVERGYLINTAIQYILNFIQDNGKMSRSKLMTIKALILHSIIYDPDSELFNNKDFNLELSGLSSVQDIFSGDSNLLIQNYTYSKIFIQILSIPLRFEKMLGLLPADHNFVGQKEQAFNLPEEHPLNIANNSIIELFSNIHETNDFTSLPNDIGVPVFVELFLSASKIDAFVNTSRTEDKVRITLCHQNYLLFLKFFKNNEYLESSNSQTIELIDSFEPLIRSDSVEFESCRTLLDKTVEDLPNLLVYSQLFSRLISANNSRKSSLNKTTKLAKINAKVVVESDLDIN